MPKNPLTLLNIFLIILALSGTAISVGMLVAAFKRERQLIGGGFVTSLIDRITLRRGRRNELIILSIHLLLVYLNFDTLFNQDPTPFHHSLLVRGVICILLQYNSISDFYDRRKILSLTSTGKIDG